MSDEPTPGYSPDPSDTGGPENRSADPLPGHFEKAPGEKSSRWKVRKTRAYRIFPPRTAATCLSAAATIDEFERVGATVGRPAP
jgi:hypothetical protein